MSGSGVKGFAHLRVHSGFSFLEGTARVEEIAAAAAAGGASAVALTDTDGLFGVVPFISACRESGIRPLIGIELTGALDPPEKGGSRERMDPFWNGPSGSRDLRGGGARGRRGSRGEGVHRMTLLARNNRGYAEISRLATARKLDGAFCLRRAVEGLSGDVYILSDDPRILAVAAGRGNARAALPPNGGTEGKRERWLLRRAAGRCGLGTVAAGRVMFIEPRDHFTHRVLRAIATRRTVGTLRPSDCAPPHAWLHPPDRVLEAFRGDTASIEEAAAIADDCRLELDLDKRRLPAFPLPSGEDPSALLRRAAFDGLKRRGIGPGLARRAAEQLEYELSVVAERGLTDYFLICWDIVRFAAERGMRSLGRGSAGNSILSFALGITHINPLEMNMFFERFLNPGREQLPDIDIDFATEDREEVLRYIFDRYGAERVAMIGTYNTFRARGAVREASKALGIPEKEFGPVVRRIPFFARAKYLREASAASPGAAGVDCDAEPLRSVLPLAVRIEGLPRHMSAHPCGIVISPDPVTDMIPLQRCAKGYEITQWSMDEIEKAGFLKLDVIGQKGLAVIRDSEAAARGAVEGPAAAGTGGSVAGGRRRAPHRAGPAPRERPAPDRKGPAPGKRLVSGFAADPKTRRIIREGRTVGCFYIESPVMLQLLEQAGCEDIEVLTALSSIIRPGVSSYGGKRIYLSRHLGIEPVKSIHPVVDEVLEDTYGCLIYQEQVIRLAVAVSGMSYAEADGLRRCMSFKNKEGESMERFRRSFVEGALARGIPPETAEGVFEWISSFSGYAFCKAHSASFAMESFESAYWKANHPAEFMAAVIANGGGYYGAGEYVEEARRMGVSILPPCVERGGVRTTGRKGSIRIGLGHVKGLRAASAESIVRERPYGSLSAFTRKAVSSHGETEALIRCGAMGSFGLPIPRLLWEHRILRSVAEGGERPEEERARLAESLIGKLPPMAPFSLARRIALEMEVLGFAVSGHPLRMFDTASAAPGPAGRPLADSSQLHSLTGRDVEIVGWKVASSGARTSGSGEEMVFVTFSDPRGRFETVFFPRAYARLASELVKGRGPFHIRGRVEEEFGARALTVKDIRFARHARAQKSS